jgi:MtN3 and saliva related transmembrane protein
MADHGTRLITVIGYLAALCSTLSFAPQAWKIIRSGKTRDIALGMYVLTVAGFALWLAFGLAQAQWPLILSNGICLVFSGFILVMKLLPARKKRKVARTLDPQ